MSGNVSGRQRAGGKPGSAALRAEINRALRKGIAGIEVSKASAPTKRPTRRTTASPAFSATPGELALVEYAAAVVNPWDAGHVGIPYGSPLPTYKQIVYDTFLVTSGRQSNISWDMDAGTLADGENGIYVNVKLQYSGLTIKHGAGTDGTPVLQQERTVSITGGRMVAAAIRYEYGGRDASFGGFAEVGRTCFDGSEALPLDLRRNGVVNYYPRTPFDVEFKDSNGNLNFDSTLALLIKTVEPGQPYRFQVIAIVESNDDTPAPVDYTVGAFTTLSYGPTPLAGERLMNSLPLITTAARDAPYTKSKSADADPSKWRGTDWLKSLDKAAGMLAHGAVVGNSVINALSQAKNMARLVGPAMSLLT